MDIQEIKKIANEKWSHFFDTDTLKLFWEKLNSLGVDMINGQIFIYRKYWLLKEGDTTLFESLTPEDKKAVWRFIETEDSVEFHLLNQTDNIFEEIYTRNTENRSN
jgi:hypothetical protein